MWENYLRKNEPRKKNDLGGQTKPLDYNWDRGGEFGALQGDVKKKTKVSTKESITLQLGQNSPTKIRKDTAAEGGDDEWSSLTDASRVGETGEGIKKNKRKASREKKPS